MTREIWINLPVGDVNRSREFFLSIGFLLNKQHGNTSESASLLVGSKQIVLMLFPEATFRMFTGAPASDTSMGAEVLFSIDAESREEVDEMARNVVKGGGTIYSAPGDSGGWMYGFGFTDPDGHRWNVLHMDFSKMPKA